MNVGVTCININSRQWSPIAENSANTLLVLLTVDGRGERMNGRQFKENSLMK